MTDYRTPLLAAAIVAGLGVTAARAQDVPDAGVGPGGMDFATLDADGDGAITAAELEAAAAARFAAADADGDGALSADEMVAAQEARRAEREAARRAETIARFDENGDGLLQQEEIEARAPRAAWMLDRMDADGDGSLSEEEFEQARGPGMRGHFGEGEGPSRHGGEGHGRHGGEGMFGHDGGHHGPRGRG